MLGSSGLADCTPACRAAIPSALLKPGRRAPDDCDRGAGVRQGLGDGAPDTAPASGHERHAARQFTHSTTPGAPFSTSGMTLNNRAENWHRPVRKRERAMQRFKSPEHAQRFLETFSAVCNHFRPRRHRLSAKRYRQIMSERFHEWWEIARLAPTG
jgi:hypothetical protein